ncbi:MAG: M23 family metallopeptidase [Gammaproteobacteria bacterium]
MPRYPVQGPITQGFGPGIALDGPATYQGRQYPHFNRGLDFGVPEGTAVHAVVAGKVVYSGCRNVRGERKCDNTGWGKTVWVEDANGVIHNYGHLSSVAVGEGATIAQGQLLGESGNTGASTGPHLSYDIFRLGANGMEPIDPEEYLDAGSSPAGTTSTMPTALTPAQQRNADLIASRAYQYALKMGLDDGTARAFARTVVTISWTESELGAVGEGPFGDSGQSVGLFHTHIGGRNLSGLGEQAGSVAQLAARLADPEVDIANSLPELFRGFQQVAQNQSFNADPLRFTMEVSRVAQRPRADILAQSGPRFAVGLGIPAGALTAGGIPASGSVQPQNVVPIETFGSGAARPTTAPPPATTAEAALKAIQDKITAAATSGDPAQLALIPQLGAAAAAIQEATGAVSPDVMFTQGAQDRRAQASDTEETRRTAMQIAANAGISAAEIEASRSNLNAQLSHQAHENSLDRAVTTWAQTGDWTIAREQMAQDQRQFEATYGLSQEEMRQGWAALGLQERSLEATIANQEGRLALDTRIHADTFGLDQQIAADNRNINFQRLELEKQNAVRQEKEAALSALVDLVAMQVDAGNLTARAAEKALDALVETWTATGGGQDFMPGYEPGGAYSAILGIIGGHYDPRQYRVRPFPLDLESMAKAGAQFDLSKAWATAREMLAGSGLNLGTSPETLPAGVQGGPQTPSPAGGLYGEAAPGAAPPASVPGMTGPQIPVQTVAEAQQMAAPGGIPAAQPAPAAAAPPALPPNTAQAPATNPPAAPALPPQCPPDTRLAWDGGQYVCQPAPSSGAPVTPAAPAAPAGPGLQPNGTGF